MCASEREKLAAVVRGECSVSAVFKQSQRACTSEKSGGYTSMRESVDYERESLVNKVKCVAVVWGEGI